MIVKELEIRNELGIHARVASRIVREVRRFESNVTVREGGEAYNFRNITGVITVHAKKGKILTIEFDGPDEQEASEAIAALFADKFGER